MFARRLTLEGDPVGVPGTVYPFVIVTSSPDRAGVCSRSRRGRGRSADHRNHITDRHRLGALSQNSFGRGRVDAISELDQWLRRRIRMCYWKQWRRTRTKVRNLPALGTSRRHAILTPLSSKSCRHLSQTPATQSGMTNEWLKSQGLIDIRTM